MKKWMIIFFILTGLSVGSIYIFIPSKITVSNVRYIKAYQNTVLKFLTDSNSQKLTRWLGTVAKQNENGYNYKGYNYSIKRTISNIVELEINSEKFNLKSNLISLNVYLDSSVIQWATEIEAGPNPINRLMKYREARQLKESMSGLMNQMKIYLDNPENMYGITVKEVQLKDSIIITTKIITKSYPEIKDVYEQVKKLTDYAGSQHIAFTGAPMLYVYKNSENQYQSMIGLPVKNIVPETNDIRIKRMPYGGNMFVADIKGGFYSIQKGFEDLNTYLIDSKRTSPAIPFELMVTDRSIETDTAKWITRLYYPIM